MEKKFIFRPGNYYRVEVKIELETNRRGYVWKDGKLKETRGNVFSAMQTIYWRNSCLECGQCFGNPDVLDTVKNGKLCEKDKVIYLEVFRLWKNYHLNDMHAGCEHQKEGTPIGEICPICGYRYGSAWLYREIPEKDLEAIKHLFAID